MHNVKKYALYTAIGLAIYYFSMKYIKRQKYMKPFLDMGFGKLYLSKFTTDELFHAWNYLKNYSLKGIKLTPEVDAELYAKVKAMNDKYKIFSNLN